MHAEIQPRLMTVAEVAEVLHVAKRTVYRLMESGQLVYVRIGRARRVPVEEIDGFIESAKTGGFARNGVNPRSPAG
ncbi:MAG: helix-turn-helix domain-containing protein [Planctomycetaceae bacterium]